MDTRVGRRHALATFGAAGLGVLLSACGDSGDSGGAGDSATTTSGPAPSTAGATGTSASGDLAARFDAATTCSLTPEQMEGPYYIDVDAIRSDIRDDREGSPLRLGVRVLDEACEPLSDAVVEVWHCDAAGTYSGFEAESAAANDAPGGPAPAAGAERFLRGGQVTDGDGIAQILTIYPGWYQGRAVHVHAKVHIGNAEALTTQLYFDDEVSDTVFATSPYDGHTGRRVTNAEDGIYADGPVLTLSEDGDGHLGLVTLAVTRG